MVQNVCKFLDLFLRGISGYLWGTSCKMFVRPWIFTSLPPSYIYILFLHLLAIYMQVRSFCIICLFFPLGLLYKIYIASYLLPTRYLFFHDFTILLCQFKSGFYNHILTILTTGDQDLSFTVVLHQTSKHDTLYILDGKLTNSTSFLSL